MPICKGLSSPQQFDQVTHLRAPLDSTAIYPITRSPNERYETGKIENLSRLYLCLAHSTWDRWWRSWHFSRWILFLDRTCKHMIRPMKTCKLLPHTPLWERLAPPYTIMGKTLRQLFIWLQSPKVESIKQGISSRCFSWASTSSKMMNTTWRQRPWAIRNLSFERSPWKDTY